MVRWRLLLLLRKPCNLRVTLLMIVLYDLSYRWMDFGYPHVEPMDMITPSAIESMRNAPQ